MKDFLSGLFGDDKDPSADELDAPTAAAALFIEVALADGHYAQAEADAVHRALTEAFDLDDAAAAAMTTKAETLARNATDHHRFTRVLKQLPLEKKQTLITALWRIVFADRDECPFEEALVRRLADLLHVPPRDARLARQTVRDAVRSGA